MVPVTALFLFLIGCSSALHALSSRYGHDLSYVVRDNPRLDHVESLGHEMKMVTNLGNDIDTTKKKLAELREIRNRMAQFFASIIIQPQVAADGAALTPEQEAVNSFLTRFAPLSQAVQNNEAFTKEHQAIIEELSYHARQMPEAVRRDYDAIIEAATQYDEAKQGEVTHRKVLQMRQDLYTSLLADMGKQDPLGKAIANGIAGTNRDMFGADVIDSPMKGLQLGIIYRAAQACGSVVGDRSAQAAKHFLGGFLDNIFDTVSHSVGFVNNLIFHKGVSPFTVREVSGMQDTVNRTMVNLSELVRDGLKDSMRSAVSMLRVEDQAEDKTTVTGWSLLIGGYIRMFKRCSDFIDAHIGYYKPDSLEYFYASEIRNRVNELILILKQSKSVKDLDATIDSNKSLLVAYKQNFASYFELLKQVAQQTATDVAVTRPQAQMRDGMYGYSGARVRDEDDDYPLRTRGG